MRLWWHAALCALLAALPSAVQAHHAAQHALPPELRQVGLDQRLHEQVPLALGFRDETGRAVQLGDFFGTTPVLLVLAYYDCPRLCPLVLDGLLKSLRVLTFDVGQQFQVVTVSINPEDTPALAAARKAQYVQRYARPGAANGWHFLTGEPAAIEQLAQAVGFRYAYDAEAGEYAHASGLIVLTSQGTIARYLYGIEYAPRDLRLGLVEASANRIGSPLEQVLLFCYRYDPATGKYTLMITNVIRVAGLSTVLALGTFMGLMWRRDRQRGGQREG
jgi:protein SCO1/2